VSKEKERVYDIAKEFTISSEALIKILRSLGYDVKSHMSIVDDEMKEAIIQKFTEEKKAAKARVEKKREFAALSQKQKLQAERARKRKARAEKEKTRKKEKGKPRKTDKKVVMESVKKTLASLEAGKKLKKYRRKTREVEEVQEEKKVIKIFEYASVAELAERMEIPIPELIKKCMESGLMVTKNHRLDMDTIEMLADDYGFTVEPMEEYIVEEEDEEEEEENLESRPPVVTVMGHVDHGKTSILDYYRKSNIVSRESGGITQHIGAYVVLFKNQLITFLDTPGHEAFTAMRARGAQVTDIVVLVVAADDDVMPQTVEAIDHAQAAGVPIIVAINKIDLPNADMEKIKQNLTKYKIVPEEWGGKHIVIEVSAKTGEGMDKLLEMIVLQTEMLELKANPHRRVDGTVIESKLDRGKGPICTILVKRGTLNQGDPFVTGLYHGKVRTMFNEYGKKVKEITPGLPVQVLGSSGTPQAGDSFMTVNDEAQAKQIGMKRQIAHREQRHRQAARISLKDFFGKIQDEKVATLNIIIKGDVRGSVEALSEALEKLSTDQVKVNIIHEGVGPINESDILLASASDTIIIGFHVRPNQRARELAETEKVDIHYYNVIYEAVNEIKSAMEGMLAPEEKEKIIGYAEVRETFQIPKVGTVAGVLVTSGKVSKNAKVRIIRDGIVLNECDIGSLKRFKEDAREVLMGVECGISCANFNDLKAGDQFEFYEISKVAQHL
jgi:translation initiation factor IF-2